MEVLTIPISELLFDPNNARKHSQQNLDAIKGSLTKFGQQKPVVVNNKNIIVAGNGTVAAAKELGWTEIKAVRTNLDDFMQTAFGLADNKTSELAEWDDEQLVKSLAALKLGDFDIHSIGFDDIDLETIQFDAKDGAKELSEEEFSNFDNQCPKCGFEFDNKPT